MTQSQPNRFPFHTQCPRDDGCGVFVLQMLTGMSYDDVAAMIDWGDKSAHYTTWNDLCGVLAEIGLSVENPDQNQSMERYPGGCHRPRSGGSLHALRRRKRSVL